MNINVDTTDNGLAAVIDEITSAKSSIKLDCHDFADMLKSNGKPVVISADAPASMSVKFSVLCKEVGNKIFAVLGDKRVCSMVFYITHPENYTLTMDDLNSLDIVFSNPQFKDVTTKFGLGENNNNTVKLITILKITE